MNKFNGSSDGEEHLCRIFRSKTHGNQFVEPFAHLHGNIDNQKECGHAQQNQADSEDNAHLLTDRTENKVFRCNRDNVRPSLEKAGSEPSAGAHAEEALC